MKVRFELFAAAREAAGAAVVGCEPRDGGTVEAAVRALAAVRPSLEPLVGRCRFAVGDEYVEAGRVLAPGETVAVIPPVSGGA